MVHFWATLACAQLAVASASHWKSQQFKSIVTFGDSYTDESRLNYFSQHNGTAPPPGWVDPVVSSVIFLLNI
jgi:hypothetical protein